MLYVLIPCLILLIVAVVLKKRESANEENSPENGKKSAAKKSNKKTTARSSRSTNTTTSAARTTAPVALAPKSTPLDPEFKKNIEQLIHTENFFSAEAKINQALNQDNSQHELYLYLLDIHLAQKDEFATKQLINYLRSLGLHDIADQAEEKQNQATFAEPHQTESVTQSFKASVPTAPTTTHAAFDALMDSPTPTAPQPSSFDLKLNDQAASNGDGSFDYVVEKKAPADDLAALDFNLDSNVKAAPVVENVEFSAATTTQPETLQSAEVPPLEFSFNLAPQTEQPVVEPVKQEFSNQDLVFDQLSLNETPVQDSPVVETKAEFDFNLEPTPAPISTDSEFDFKLDTPVETARSTFTHDTNEFDLAPHVETATQQDTDPLAQSFPELTSTDEIQLNLDLATKYIQLGAYDAAKRILSEHADQYSVEQRNRSEKLLNQIAS